MEALRTRIANADALLANCRAANVWLRQEIEELRDQLDD
jgi:hypothetical protein